MLPANKKSKLATQSMIKENPFTRCKSAFGKPHFFDTFVFPKHEKVIAEKNITNKRTLI